MQAWYGTPKRAGTSTPAPLDSGARSSVRWLTRTESPPKPAGQTPDMADPGKRPPSAELVLSATYNWSEFRFLPPRRSRPFVELEGERVGISATGCGESGDCSI